jgi:hypothetical protein
VLPAILLLSLYSIDTALVTYGLKQNPYLKNNLAVKFAAQVPNASGSFGEKPADQGVVVFLLGARINHPLGILAPGAAELGKHASAMYRELTSSAAMQKEFGLIGASSLTNNVDESKNELITLMYFRDYEGLHKYAHSTLHRQAWDWWNRQVKGGDDAKAKGTEGVNQVRHISIWHETYVVPKGNWETIYAQSEPTGLGAGRVYVDGESKEGDESAQGKWMSTLVDARKGVMKTSKGRMARSQGTEHEGYEESGY